ncbi:MAG: ROK family protein [Ruminococcus sp.]
MLFLRGKGLWQYKRENFAFLNFGRGIGATLFTEGSMLGTASGSSTQFGHYSIDPHGPECICGNHGCLEVMISEQALKNRIPEFGQIPSLSALSEITFSRSGKGCHLPRSNRSCYGKGDGMGAVHRPE